MSALWRGTWATRARIASGLVLFAYAFFHFLNIGLGLFSPELMEAAQDWRQVITRSVAGTLILYGSLLLHAGLALGKLAGRRTLRMPAWEAVQLGLGIVIPLLLAVHLIHTRMAHEVYGVNDEVGYIITLLWGHWDGVKQSVLLLIVWIHGCIGLHFWLRHTRWWRNAVPWMSGIAALVPAFALAGFMIEGRRLDYVMAFEGDREQLMEEYNWPDWDTFMEMAEITRVANTTIWSILAFCLVVYFARRLMMRSRSVRIEYQDGPVLSAPRGMTLLEMSRSAGVPHTALCGGRGRCTTCRVAILKGADSLPPPSSDEEGTLTAVGAPPGTRLACQIRPEAPLTVFRVFRPDGRRARAHAGEGSEQRLAIMFLDMRGFTARTTGQLPYDVVFLLNRFFDAVVPSITGAGGTVDKYLGDGLLAIFETDSSEASARAALQAAAGVRGALTTFNQMIAAEGSPTVEIGMAIHLGDLVLGEIGAAGQSSRTIIGDTVNVASRLEAQTKALGVDLLISEAVLDAAGHATDGLPMVDLELRGVAHSIRALAVSRRTRLDDLLARDDAAAAPAI